MRPIYIYIYIVMVMMCVREYMKEELCSFVRACVFLKHTLFHLISHRNLSFGAANGCMRIYSVLSDCDRCSFTHQILIGMDLMSYRDCGVCSKGIFHPKREIFYLLLFAPHAKVIMV